MGGWREEKTAASGGRKEKAEVVDCCWTLPRRRRRRAERGRKVTKTGQGGSFVPPPRFIWLKAPQCYSFPHLFLYRTPRIDTVVDLVVLVSEYMGHFYGIVFPHHLDNHPHFP